MAQVIASTDEHAKETVNLYINDPDFDFSKAKQIAKERAFEKTDYPLILSWKNSKTGEFYPNYECGVNDTPFWIRYAESRGANLTVDFNDGEYIFMILKM